MSRLERIVLGAGAICAGATLFSVTALAVILWADAAEAGASPIHCYTFGVAQILVPDIFNSNPEAKRLGLTAERVELLGEITGGSEAGACGLEITTNKGGAPLKYVLRYRRDGSATLDILPVSEPILARQIAEASK